MSSNLRQPARGETQPVLGQIQPYIIETVSRLSLISAFVRRDLGIKYSQSVLGVSWVLLQPVTGAVVFTFFFTQLFSWFQDIPIPYHLFAFSGYLCWLLFSQIIAVGGLSLVHEEQIIKKVYFPRILIPLAKCCAALVDFFIGLVVLIIISAFWKPMIIFNVPLIIPAVFLIMLNGLSIAIGLSVLTIRNRDLHHIIPYLINFGIWLTPVFFPSNIFPDEFRFVIDANPLAYSIELFRSLLFGTALPKLNVLIVSSQLIMFLALMLGLVYFIKIDCKLSDYL
tara:strand:- start:136 stop:981 length:846 start_codon:yes stop_codon:yes gene_type:complete